MGGEDLNRDRESVVESNFLCSKYDGRANLAANKTDLWERDHSCNIKDVTTDGKYLGEVDTFSIDGIQGRNIVEYSEQR